MKRILIFILLLTNLVQTVGAEERMIGKQPDFSAIIAEMQANKRALSPSEFTVKANCAEPDEEIEKAFDGKPHTIWHTPWDTPDAYPFSVEFTFPKKELLEKIWYLPRQVGKNGFILEYELWGKESADGEWKKLQRGILPHSSDARFISFPSGSFSALRLDILNGSTGFASAAEFLLFRAAPEQLAIDELFSDGSFSELRRNEKGKLPPNLKKRIEELKSQTKDPRRREELRLAESLLKKPKDLDRKVFSVVQKPSVQYEWKTTRSLFPWCSYQPTGLTIEADEPFTVYLDAQYGDPTPVLVVNDLKSGKWFHQAHFPLSPGRNYLKSPISGIIYIDNPYESSSQKPQTIHIENAHFMPFFQLGKTTPKQWAQMSQEFNLYGMVELSSEHVLISASAENVRKYLDDPMRLLKSYESLTDLYAELMGFSDEDENPVHHRPHNLLHLTEVDHSYMYASPHRMGFHHLDAMNQVLNSETFLKNGWGPWHEIGHMHQMPMYKFQGVTEVTVNIYSLEMQTSLGLKARIDTPQMHQKLMEYFAKPNRNYHNEKDVFMKLAMFWQLRMAFGKDFYPQLHRHYRETQVQLPDSEAKVNHFACIASEIANRNLEPFFDAWGLPLTEETRETLKKFKPLKQKIWLNFNFSNP